ncbi:MAG: Ig-like domain-containing protein [Bryobacteraceae bacterium]
MNRRLTQALHYVYIAVASLLLPFSPEILLGQTVQITSPQDGSVVSSGQTLTVTVTADPSAVQGVAVLGQSPLGSAPLLTAPPYQFNIDIPSDITSGIYSLTAIGIPQSGTNPIMSPITIDIERSDMPVQVWSELSSILFGYAGDTDYLLITGVFADGSRVVLTRSTQITYSSDTPAVATVDGTGLVTAIAPGAANITATYGNATIGQTSVTVPVTVPPAVAILAPVTSLYVSQSEHLTALLNMAPGVDETVTWSINPALGSIDNTGL